MTVAFGHQIVDKVREQYERYPYPGYPILATPRWQEGYLGFSSFAAKLFLDHFQSLAAVSRVDRPSVLVAGCGEIQPAVFSRGEPRHHHLSCWDLSKRSVRRAQFRTGLHFRSIDYQVGDIDHLLNQSRKKFSHVDLFGVLHHLSDPGLTLTRLANRLEPQATLRVMIYNQPARIWLRHLKDLLRSLGVSPFDAGDLGVAHNLIARLSAASPSLSAKLEQIPRQTWGNRPQFVDTFLHRRDLLLPLARWLALFEDAGLTPFALFDRYGELDHLVSPLQELPVWTELAELINAGDFCGNLEIYLAFGQPEKLTPARRFARGRAWSAPPVRWFSYPETQGVPISLRWQLWRLFFQVTFGGREVMVPDSLLKKLQPAAWQRLGRIGAVFPSMFHHSNYRELVMAPVASYCADPPSESRATKFAGAWFDVERTIVQLAGSRGLTAKRIELVKRRLRRLVETLQESYG